PPSMRAWRISFSARSNVVIMSGFRGTDTSVSVVSGFRVCEQITFNAEAAEAAEKKCLGDFSACSASSAFKRRIFSQALKPDAAYNRTVRRGPVKKRQPPRAPRRKREEFSACSANSAVKRGFFTRLKMPDTTYDPLIGAPQSQKQLIGDFAYAMAIWRREMNVHRATPGRVERGEIAERLSELQRPK